MRNRLLLVVVVGLSGVPGLGWLTNVREHNTAQVRGHAAATRHQPAEAAYYFGQAVALAGRSGPSPTLLLNLAQAQAQAGQLPQARATYGRLLAATVPPPLGSTARQQLAVLLAQAGQPAQAIDLLRQALRLNPNNTIARYNYELLVQYLRGQPAPAPPPSRPAPPATAKPDSASGAGKRPQPSGQPTPAPAPHNSPTEQQPDLAANSKGLPTPALPAPRPGNNASGSRQAEAGPARPLPSGRANGTQRGLDQRPNAESSAAAGPGRRPGTATATDVDLQLQTQRERLKAMNMTPAQAQQLLEALRTSEQQYLQQRPRARTGAPPAPGTPTW